MNNEQYLKALAKALSTLDRKSREDILKEIQSHANELGDDNNSLLQRFGSPESLASEYLDGNNPPPGIGKKIYGIGAKVVSIIGVSLVALIALIALILWIISGDKFDYANESAEEITEISDWKTTEWDEALSVEVQQAHTVFYWNNNNTLRWHCRGREFPDLDNNGSLKIRHGFCIVYLPMVTTDLRVEQGNVVLVQPKANLNIEAEQSNVRIAENNATLEYQIDALHSDIGNFVSQDNALIRIEISTKESSIEHYKY